MCHVTSICTKFLSLNIDVCHHNVGRRKEEHEKEDMTKETNNLLWTSENTLKLIACYQDNQFLWNPKLKDFYKKGKRDAKLAEFTSVLENKFSGKLQFCGFMQQHYYLIKISNHD